MGVNKVVMNTENGEVVLMDLTGDSVTPETLAKGVTAHDASGNEIEGQMTPGDYGSLTLGIHTDGLLYIFVNGIPTGNGVAIPNGVGDIVGNVDSGNNIVLSGNIPDGTYTVKYEMDDGSTVNIGSLVLDTTVYYPVTKNLTHCSISNGAVSVIEGDPYSATITANDGYELKSVTVTMGGANVSVTNGAINIASVTGNIIITAVAEEMISYNDLAKTITEGNRLNSSGGLTAESGRAVCEDYIPFTAGSVVRIKGFDWANNTSYNAFYDSSKKALAAGQHIFPGENSTKTIKWERESNDVWKYTNISNSCAFIRFSGVLKGTASDVIITLNEEIS